MVSRFEWVEGYIELVAPDGKGRVYGYTLSKRDSAALDYAQAMLDNAGGEL